MKRSSIFVLAGALALLLSCENAFFSNSQQATETLSVADQLQQNKALIQENADRALNEALVLLGIEGSSRSIEAQNQLAEVSNLTEAEKAELDRLIEEFNAAMPEAPMIFTGEIPSGCGEDERYLYIGGLTYDKLNPENTERLSMLSEIYAMDQAGEEIPEEYFTATRGVYMSDVPKWPDGEIDVAYDKSQISEEAWEVLYEGLEQWETQSDGAVSFNIISPNWWEQFCWGIGLNPYVWVTVGPTQYNAPSSIKSCGYNAKTKITLCNLYWDRLNLDLTANGPQIRSYLSHEMGHALGLMHEHQRPDRDDYVKIGTKPDYITQAAWEYNYGKLEEVYFLWVFLVAEPITVGSFDFSSIMIDGYGGTSMSYADGTYMKTNHGHTVSATDGLTIQQLY